MENYTCGHIAFKIKITIKILNLPLDFTWNPSFEQFFVGMLLLGRVNFGMSVSPFRPTDFLPTSSWSVACHPQKHTEPWVSTKVCIQASFHERIKSTEMKEPGAKSGGWQDTEEMGKRRRGSQSRRNHQIPGRDLLHRVLSLGWYGPANLTLMCWCPWQWR